VLLKESATSHTERPFLFMFSFILQGQCTPINRWTVSEPVSQRGSFPSAVPGQMFLRPPKIAKSQNEMEIKFKDKRTTTYR